MKKQHLSKILLLALLLCSLGLFIWYGAQKEGFHVDEIYSYGLANSEYLPFLHFGEMEYSVKDWMNTYGAGESLADLFTNLWKDFQILKESGFAWRDSEIYQNYLIAQANSADTYTTTWVDGTYYQDYLAVSKSNTFNIASVYYNQRGDVHPPLFYILLHLICSVFQGQFSVWFGLGLNIVLMLLAEIALYHLVKNHLGGKKVALACLAVYAFSYGCVTSVLFLRMYCLLTLMTLLCCAMHLRVATEGYCLQKKSAILLGLSVLGGYMTHYYFVIYAGLLAGIFCICIILHKKWKSLLFYILSMGSSAVIGILIWPFSIKHVFGGYRGTQALSSLSDRFSVYCMKTMLQVLNKAVLGAHTWVAVALATLVFFGGVVLILIKKGILKRISTEALVAKSATPSAAQMEKLALFILPPFGYLCAVSQIVPYLVDRYIMCTFPFACVLAVALPAAVFGKFLQAKKQTIALLLLTGVLLLCNNTFVNGVGYLNTGGCLTISVPAQTYCVYVLPTGTYNESAADTTILAQCAGIAVIYEGNLEQLTDTYTYTAGDTLMIAVLNSLDNGDEIRQKVLEILDVAWMEEAENFASGTAQMTLYQ